MEDIIKSDPLVKQCTVIGEGKQCTGTLIELNLEAVHEVCLDIVYQKGNASSNFFFWYSYSLSFHCNSFGNSQKSK